MATQWTIFSNTETVQLTTKEILALLSSNQKVGFLNAYTQGWADNYPKVKALLRIRPTAIARHLKLKLDEIQVLSRKYMRGEIVVEPEVLDPETGEIITPAVYNTAPTVSTELLNLVKGSFVDEFTSEQISAILTKMIQYSKSTGDGTWTYYKTEIVK